MSTPEQDRQGPPRGRIMEMDLTTAPPEPPEMAGAEIVYLLLRWQGRPVGRMILKSGQPISASRFRWEAVEAAAAGMAAARAAELRPLYTSEMPVEKAKEMKEELRALDLLRLKDKHIVKIVDFIPTDASELNKVMIDVSLDQDEVNKILDVTRKY